MDKKSFEIRNGPPMPYPTVQIVCHRDSKTHFTTVLPDSLSSSLLKYLAMLNWDFTEKIDGLSVRVWYDGNGAVHLLTRTGYGTVPMEVKSYLSSILPVENKMLATTPLTLYGVVTRDDGKYGRRFIVHDILQNGVWLGQSWVTSFSKDIGAESVPVLGSGTLYDMIKLVQNGLRSYYGNFVAMGIVAKPQVCLLNSRGRRIAAKIQHIDFVGNLEPGDRVPDDVEHILND